MTNTKQISKIIKAILVIAFVIWLNQYVNIDMLQARIMSFGALAPLVYIILYTVLPALFFPAISLVVLAGLLFGFYQGLVYTAIAVVTNTIFMYLISNKLAKEKIANTVRGKLPKKYYDLIYSKNQKVLVTTFFVARFIPVIPYILVNYLAGLTEINFFYYLITTIVGVIPWMMVYLNIGANVGDVTSKEFMFSVIILVVFTILSLVAKNIIEKKNGINNNPDL